MIEEVACWLIVWNGHDLNVSMEQTVRHLEEGLEIVELLEILRIVKGIVTNSEVGAKEIMLNFQLICSSTFGTILSSP